MTEQRMDEEESLRRELVEFLTEHREEIAGIVYSAILNEYPYMLSIASQDDGRSWALSELDGLIEAFAQNDASGLCYRSFYGHFVMYSVDAFRAFFNFLDWMYLFAKYVLSYVFASRAVDAVRTRKAMQGFEDFVLDVLKENTRCFLERELEPGSIIKAIEPDTLRKRGARLSDPGLLQIAGSNNATALLTAREQEVGNLVAMGLSNKEIGARTGISIATVKNHVGSILSKLQLDNRTEIALWFNQEELD